MSLCVVHISGEMFCYYSEFFFFSDTLCWMGCVVLALSLKYPSSIGFRSGDILDSSALLDSGQATYLTRSYSFHVFLQKVLRDFFQYALDRYNARIFLFYQVSCQLIDRLDQGASALLYQLSFGS